jgi:Skp family chaperone for outer membrane proteins
MAGVLLRPPHRGLILQALAVALVLSSPVPAQEAAPPAIAPILTLDENRFFLESDFGRAVIGRERAASAALEEENKRIEAELVAEERALTEQRAALSAAEFSALATAFDEKVERIRSAQDAKSRALVEQRDRERQQFLRLVMPVLDELLQEHEATAILDQGTVIRSLSAVDITDEAIAKLNEAMATGDGKP